MKKQWIYFYIKLLISFFVYFLLNSYFNYLFSLNMKIMIIIFLNFIIISVVFILKNKNTYVCGIITSSVFLVLTIGEIIRIFFLAKRNIGESGFGILEIICLLPLLIINFIYLILYCIKLKSLYHNV